MASHAMEQTGLYRITVQGLLDREWASYFEDLEILPGNGENTSPVTFLMGKLADQAALQGTLQKLYALGLPLVSVEKLETIP